MPIVMLLIVESNAIVVQDSWEIHTADVNHHQDQFVNQIPARQMASALFKKMVNRFASVHLEWAETQQQPDAMAMNVVPIAIAQSIMHV